MDVRDKLYLSAEEAAEYVGIGIHQMREFMNSADPPPYKLFGKVKKLQRKALEPYFEQRQEVRL